MATAKITVDEGTTTNLATYTISEDAVTKHINRSILSNNAGADTGVAGLPLQVSLANTGANSNKLLVTPDSVALPANQSVNVAQINGVTPLMGNGVTGTGSHRVTIASDNTPYGVKLSSVAKTRTSLWSATTLTAGAGNTTSSTINLSAGYGAQINFQLTNGATGPTIAAQVQIQVANDSGATLFVNYGGALVGSVTNSAVVSWSINLPIGIAAVKLVAGSNTAQNVTVDADISNVTVF